MNVTAKLVILYRVDQQLKALKSRVKSAEKYYNAQNGQLKSMNAELTEMRSDALHLTAHAGNLENDVRSLEERLAHVREQMNSAKTNREYTAFLTELNTFKADKDLIESDALKSLEEVEDLENQIAELDQQIKERKKVKNVAETELKQRKSDISDRLVELETKRLEATKDIPEMALREYDTRMGWGDEPMAEIIEQDRRRMEYACGECFMTIPIEKFSTVLGRGDMTMCPSCRRILFVGDELYESHQKRISR